MFKKKRNKFEKLYHLLNDTIYENENIYNDKYLFLSARNFTKILELFSNFFYKNLILIFSIFFAYILISYKIQLQLLSIPTSLISIDNLINVLQSFVLIISQFGNSWLIIISTIFLNIIIVPLLIRDYKEHKMTNKKRKVLFSGSIAIFFLISMIWMIFYQKPPLKKSEINIKNFTLNQYINNSLYPRIAKEKNSSEKYYLVLGKEVKSYDTYELDHIINDTNKTGFYQDINDKDFNKTSYSTIMIALLKHSDFVSTKNILPIKIERLELLDRNGSLYSLKNELEK